MQAWLRPPSRLKFLSAGERPLCTLARPLLGWLLLLLLRRWLVALEIRIQDQPIELAADSVDIDEQKGLSIYRGDVDLRPGQHPPARRRGHRAPGRAQALKVVAEGRPVRFEQMADQGGR